MVGSCPEAFPLGREWSNSPPQSAGSGQKALSEQRVWSGGPPGELGLIGRPSRWAASGPEALPVGREW